MALLTACGIPWLVGGVLILRRRIPFRRITEVGLHDVKECGKGRKRLHELQAVDVVTGRRTLRLAGFRDGSLALYRAVDDGWRAATAR